jgi:hypothetical protein
MSLNDRNSGLHGEHGLYVGPYNSPVKLFDAYGNYVGGEYGSRWFVDGNRGDDDNNGRSADKPFLTMNAAFSSIQSGDTIYVRGNIREQLTTPAGVFDVKVIGPSPVTRHPDAHTSNGGYSSARWNAPASPTASTPLVKVQQQGWIFKDILFTGDENDGVGCIQLFRDGGAGDAERDGSHAQIIGCRFAGGLYGIQDSGGCARVFIYGDNEFQQFSESDNDAIVSVVGAGIGTLWGWKIKGNTFQANHTDIDAALTGAQIVGNHFVLTSLGVTNTVAIDTTGGSRNLIAQNYMYSASNAAGINARFVVGSNDIYSDNYYSDIAEYAEPAE